MVASSADTRARAFGIIRDKSFVRKKVILASGQESDHYFDMKPSMLAPEGALCLAEMILDRIGDTDVDYVGGLEMGAVPLIGPIALKSLERGKPIAGMFVRKAAKGHGTQRLIEGVEDVTGRKIVIVEDVTTTGNSALKAISVLKDAGAEIVLVLSILDRQQGATELYKAEGLPFASLFQASEFLAL